MERERGTRSKRLLSDNSAINKSYLPCKISIFYNKLPKYNPQLKQGKPYKKINYLQNRSTGIYGKTGEKENYQYDNKGSRYPKTILEFSNPNNKSLHPTQKPIPLLEYLIKTYTNEGDTVLDFTMGSGSTGVAAKNTNRKFSQ